MDVAGPNIADVGTKTSFSCGTGDGQKQFDFEASSLEGRDVSNEILHAKVQVADSCRISQEPLNAPFLNGLFSTGFS